jgi:succinate dehydrogenase / fumarate reductase iron-sulfur subunit
MPEDRKVMIDVLRRDDPESKPYWQRFGVPYEPGMNLTACLQRIAANPVTTEGTRTTPVAYDSGCLEEVCGSCTMLVNGHVRQACTALVEQLWEQGGPIIRLEPMTKFPTVRDLVVDRSRLFSALKKVKAWVEVDDYYDRGPGPRIAPDQQEEHYPLSRCMSCGCCLEVCPQYNDNTDFLGPHAISQAIMFNGHPTGKLSAAERLNVLVGPGGIADCGNAQNCVEVCPKEVPLTDSIARAGRQTTVHAITRWLRT